MADAPLKTILANRISLAWDETSGTWLVEHPALAETPLSANGYSVSGDGTPECLYDAMVAALSDLVSRLPEGAATMAQPPLDNRRETPIGVFPPGTPPEVVQMLRGLDANSKASVVNLAGALEGDGIPPERAYVAGFMWAYEMRSRLPDRPDGASPDNALGRSLPHSLNEMASQGFGHFLSNVIGESVVRELAGDDDDPENKVH